MTTAPTYAAAQNEMAASTQLGSWSTTTEPGPMPRAANAPASARAARSTSANVPAHGRTCECTWKV